MNQEKHSPGGLLAFLLSNRFLLLIIGILMIFGSEEELNLKLLPVNSLYPHEEVMSSLLEELEEQIASDKLLKHPIIIDRKSHTVLDGMHRLKAVKKLDFSYIPTCLIKYSREDIKLGSWCRKLSFEKENGKIVLQKITSILEELFPKGTRELTLEKALATLQKRKRKNTFLVVSLEKGKAIHGRVEGNRNYWRIKKFEKRLMDSTSAQIKYIADAEILDNLEQKTGIYLFPPSISKSTVVNHAIHKKLLPPKSTRHVFPARPLFINVPLQFLEGDKDISRKNEEFEEFLRGKKLVDVEGETKIEGRYYEDGMLYLFKQS